MAAILVYHPTRCGDKTKDRRPASRAMANCVVAGEASNNSLSAVVRGSPLAGNCRSHCHSTFHMHSVKNVGQVALGNIKKKVKYSWEVVVEEFRKIREACGRCL